jgi:hypothetical protein
MRSPLASFPRPYATLVAGAFVATALFEGCTAPSIAEPLGSVDDAIEGGFLINAASDDVAPRFPLSTLEILDTVDTPDFTKTQRCTGVILSSWKILTAAHCVDGGVVTASFYPVGVGKGASPQGAPVTLTNPVKPDGIGCNAPFGSKTIPSDCFLANGVYADLAVLTLPNELPVPTAKSPWKPAWLAPKGSFEVGAGGKDPARWGVGVGWINMMTAVCATEGGIPDSMRNPSNLMEWVAMSRLYSASPGMIGSPTPYADLGDSGGPVYQYAGNGKNLAVVAVATHLFPSCGAGSPGTDIYVDVTQADNYDWLVHQGATETPATSTFGAGP